MIQRLWLFSHYKGRWTDGVHIITQEIISHYTWNTIREIVYNDWKISLCKDRFEVPSHRALRERLAPSWKPHTPEEIMRILDARQS